MQKTIHFIKKNLYGLIAALLLVIAGVTTMTVDFGSSGDKSVYEYLTVYEVSDMMDEDTLYRDFLPQVFYYKANIDTNNKVLLADLTLITYDQTLDYYRYMTDTANSNSLLRTIESEYLEEVNDNIQGLTEMIKEKVTYYSNLKEKYDVNSHVTVGYKNYDAQSKVLSFTVTQINPEYNHGIIEVNDNSNAYDRDVVFSTKFNPNDDVVTVNLQYGFYGDISKVLDNVTVKMYIDNMEGDEVIIVQNGYNNYNPVPDKWRDLVKKDIKISDILNPDNFLPYEYILCEVLDRKTRQVLIDEEYEDMFGEHYEMLSTVTSMSSPTPLTPNVVISFQTEKIIEELETVLDEAVEQNYYN